MDNPNITMEEYIRLEEEKALRQGQTFNWQTATYGKMEYCENQDDSFMNLEQEYPAIVFNDISDATLSCEPTVSPLDNNEFDFNTSFDESDDEDYMIWHLYHTVTLDIHGSDTRWSMVYNRDDGQALFTSHAWRRLFEVMGPLFILALGLHSEDEMAKAGFGAYWFSSERVIPDKRDIRDYWIEISFGMDFLGLAPSYVHIKDPVRRLCHRTIPCSISGRGQGTEKERNSGARLSGCYFLGRLTAHFGLVSDEGLRGLSIITEELLVIDLHELARLNICCRFGDTWAWVASGPERQQAAATGAPGATEDAPADDGVLRLFQHPCRHLSYRHLLINVRLCHRGSIDSKRRWASYSRVLLACEEWLRALLPSSLHTLVGSSPVPYQRRVRPMTGDASTSVTPHTDDHPDP
uniref:Uncharacterized protein n=1 Tax=Tanacetum cinerariifolium TaxID=118510 RepID=A0A6L2JHF5_TANCI|nr:hypothetical protein [Tanacetum cinerariifolium]